ncbi:glycoside hydrolase family 16 protein [Tilletiaria anomala UBC 951]|uniref:Glycoside hydrolase family 16 protein n=1 Tax=Tilletiaria anomala (strain ATCC 24038 / CBS 436.72 / UBC 951) TaxID=1037660 RepID=A0A066VFQ0_TILAU|nr:glycoside hydrolase family 16 protein [Tilletiaria anomala UBC 951]KDN37375.1 glycoside hydrolase family 16 protein [Tilletiaria anomala UBC 951]
MPSIVTLATAFSGILATVATVRVQAASGSILGDAEAPHSLEKRGYRLSSKWESPSSILANFVFSTMDDPSGGYVQYVNKSVALANNMFGTGTNGGLKFGADMKQVGGARRSIRLESVARYGQGLYIFDISHMPTGCGTWPAVWTYTGSDDWPYGGEVDILEGVNGVTSAPNAPSMHTGPNCTMPNSNSGMTGSRVHYDCNSANGANDNNGCTAKMTDQTISYGYRFNQNQGGVYAYQRDSSDLKIWFWSSQDAPAGTKRDDARSVDVTTWGNPSVSFPFTSTCSASHLNDNQIITMNLDFCGGYVAGRWATDGCSAVASDCNTYVSNTPNPEAYFDINAIKIYMPY